LYGALSLMSANACAAVIPSRPFLLLVVPQGRVRPRLR
jgi:hypothetical protein